MRNSVLRALCILVLLATLGGVAPAVAAADPPVDPAVRTPDDSQEPDPKPHIVFNATDVSTTYLPHGGRPGVYVGRDSDNLTPGGWSEIGDPVTPPGTWPIIGGHQSFGWKQIETGYHSYNWAPIDNFLQAMATKGKPAAIHIVTYLGPDGGQQVPDWLTSQYPQVLVTAQGTKCTPRPADRTLPKYWDNLFKQEYRNFVLALGARYKYDSRLEFVMMGLGLYGESQPEQDCFDNDLRDRLGLSQALWEQTVDAFSDNYYNAFKDGSGNLLKNIVMLEGASYLHTCGRYWHMYHAGPLGIGAFQTDARADSDNAVIPDKPGFEGCGILDPLIAWSPTRPGGQEAYQYFTPTSTLTYWMVRGILSRHVDYLTVDYSPNDVTFDGWLLAHRDGAPRYENFPHMQLAQKYLGRTVTDTPSVWVAMRDSGFTYYPQKGNYSFYLTQDDSVASGRTKLVTYRGGIQTVGCPGFDNENWLVPCSYAAVNTNILTNVNLGGSWRGKESWITRRTDQGSGNPYMWFKIDDGFVFAGSNEITIKVTYFDVGTDTWSLDYDAVGAVTRTAGTVTKANSLTWKVAVFHMTDARVGNGLLGGSDFRIDCKNNGDEYIHLVDVTKGATSETFAIPLKAGANLISVPLATGSTEPAAVLSSIAGKYSLVVAYNPFDAVDPWKRYEVDPPFPWWNDLTAIDNKMGIWLYAIQDTTLTIGGSWPSTVNIPLKTGANLIAYPGRITRPIADALSSIAGKYTLIVTYDVFDTADPWKRYEVSPPFPWWNDLADMRPGHGYWIYTNQDCTLTVTN